MRIEKLVSALSLLCITTLCWSAETDKLEYHYLGEEIASVVDPLVDQQLIPGFYLSIHKDGQKIIERVRGYSDEEEELVPSENTLYSNAFSIRPKSTVIRLMTEAEESERILFVSEPMSFNFVILSSRINSALERKHLLDREEKHRRAMEEEKERYEKLLLNILPQPIAMRMKAEEYLIADDVDECSILFADIVGFTSLAEKMGAAQIVELLNKVFSHFDDECEKLGLEKIKTIGATINWLNCGKNLSRGSSRESFPS